MDSDMDVEAGDQMTFENERPRGWWSNNWKWFVPASFFVCFLMCCGCCGGFFIFFFSAIESSKPYKLALERVRTEQVVVDRLGEPIEGLRWPPPGGNVYVEDGRGEANIEFDVVGPKGQAHVSTKARYVAGAWGLIDVTVTFDDATKALLKIDSTGQGDALGEAPKWTPPTQAKPAQK